MKKMTRGIFPLTVFIVQDENTGIDEYGEVM
jgi:hypothetical protein